MTRRTWVLWLGPFAVGVLILSTLVNDPPRANAGRWFPVLGIYLAVAALAMGYWALARVTLRQAATFVAASALVASLAFIGAASGAGTNGCQEDTDCDNGYALGTPFLAAAVFVPEFGLALLGREAARRTRVRGTN